MHLLQKEAAQLKTQYQANVSADEMNVRQIQHSQFHVSPKAQNNKNSYDTNPSTPFNTIAGGGGGTCCPTIPMKHVDAYYGKAGDLAAFIGYCGKNDMGKIDILRDLNKIAEQQSPLQKPPLQQQLMQHRLLQQKRQILQKQVALENGLSRRQMLRQQSYKIAQQQQILPPLPLNEIDSIISFGDIDDLAALSSPTQRRSFVNASPKATKFRQDRRNEAMAEGPAPPKSPCPSIAGDESINGSPKMLKTSHIHQMQPIDTWNTLSGSMQTCQISENSMAHENWLPSSPSPHYQVYFSNR